MATIEQQLAAVGRITDPERRFQAAARLLEQVTRHLVEPLEQLRDEAGVELAHQLSPTLSGRPREVNYAAAARRLGVSRQTLWLRGKTVQARKELAAAGAAGDGGR